MNSSLNIESTVLILSGCDIGAQMLYLAPLATRGDLGTSRRSFRNNAYEGTTSSVSYTHLTLPTNREV
eukprot:4767447-Heterocapsa_arctica.AAC.1